MKPATAERLIVAAGVCAALHVAKLPPAIAALQDALAITLVQAGFLLSLVQLAGMSLGALFGAWADGLGARRSMLAGLLLLALASTAGAAAPGVAALMALRVVEGFGFLLVVLPAPGWLRQQVPPERIAAALGGWSTYMPLATALALGLGPLAVPALGWRGWWALLGGLTLVMAGVLARGTSAPPRPGGTTLSGTGQRLALTLSRRGPWVVAGLFMLYAFQWLAVVGFLPTLLLQGGATAWQVGLVGAVVAIVNMFGNLAAGHALQRGVAPRALLALGCVAMALGALAFFAIGWPVPLRLAAVLLFSMCGGVIPATLFTLAVRVAPQPHATATTVGWVQQGSALGQFCGPPAVAFAAAQSGGWQFSGAVTAAAAALALILLWAVPPNQRTSTLAPAGRLDSST